MRVVVCHEYGPFDKLVVEHHPSAELRAGQARIRVHAAGVSFVQGLMVLGKYQIKPPLPFRPGGEVSGDVIEVAHDVDPTLLGQRVFVSVGMTGGWADEMITTASRLTQIPERLSYGQAATFMESYATGYFTFAKRVPVQAGETLLVLGAGSGVGLAAVDLGRALGLTVIAAASTVEKRAAAMALGAHYTIDSSTEDVKERAKELSGGGVDVIYDPVGGDLATSCLRALREEGRYAVIGFASGPIPHLPANQILLRNRSVIGVEYGGWASRFPVENQEMVAALVARIASGELNPVEPTMYPLDNVSDALTALSTRNVVGKVALSP